MNEDIEPSSPKTSLIADYSNPESPINLEDYREEIDELGWTDEECLAYLKEVEKIMTTFVHWGWGLDSISLALPELFGDNASTDAQKDGLDSVKLVEEKNAIKFCNAANPDDKEEHN